jgi:hypothetical protein
MITKSTLYDISGASPVPRYVMAQFTVDEFFVFWPQLERLLDRVPDTWRHWTKGYICDSVSTGHIQTWGIGPPGKAILLMFTAVQAYPTMKVLSIMWAAGTFEDEMAPLLDTTLTSYARAHGCTECEIRGRMGWEHKMKAAGFKRTASVWTRPVLAMKMN